MQANKIIVPSIMADEVVMQRVVQCDYSKYLGKLGNKAESGYAAISVPRIHNVQLNSHIGNSYLRQKGNASFATSYLQMPIFVASAKYTYDEEDENLYNNQRIPIAFREVLDTAMDDALSLRAHQAIVFGVEGGGGIYNLVKNIAFPADSAGKTKLVEYNIQEFVEFLRKIIVRIYASDGYGAPRDFFIAAPTRVVAMIQTNITKSIDGLKSGSTVSADVWLREALFGTGTGSNLDRYEWIPDDFLKNADLTDPDKPKDVIIVGARGFFNKEKIHTVTFADLGHGVISAEKVADEFVHGKYAKTYLTEGVFLYDKMGVKFSIEAGDFE